jgi:hypothetical protein
VNELPPAVDDGILGYGFPEASLMAARRPIAAGSSFAAMVPFAMPI